MPSPTNIPIFILSSLLFFLFSFLPREGGPLPYKRLRLLCGGDLREGRPLPYKRLRLLCGGNLREGGPLPYKYSDFYSLLFFLSSLFFFPRLLYFTGLPRRAI